MSTDDPHEALRSWLEGEPQRWWESTAEGLGYQPSSGFSFGDVQFLIEAIGALFDGSLEEFEKFLEGAEEWGPDALRRVLEVMQEREPGSWLSAADATGLLALIRADDLLTQVPLNPYSPLVQHAVEIATDEAAEKRGIPRQRRPYRSPMTIELQGSPFDEPSRWQEWLAGPAAKLMRARYQVELLGADIRAFQRNHPQRVRLQPIEEDGAPLPGAFHAITTEVVPPPLDWSVRAGEIVHDARSSLDNLFARLIDINRINTGSSKTGHRSTHFPIRDSEDAYRTYRTPRRRPDPLSEVGTDAIRQIEPNLPFDSEYVYHWPNLLLALNRLWNTDKHETLHTVWNVMGDTLQINCWHSGCDELNQSGTFWPVGIPLQDDVEVAQVRAVNPQTDLRIDVRAQISTDVFLIGLGPDFPDGRAPLLQVLSDMVEYTIRVVSSFRQFFPETGGPDRP